jgi:hypothetical protein
VRQRQAHEQAYQRVRSGATQTVNVIEGKKSSIHAAFLKVTSGQLRFLGLTFCVRRGGLDQAADRSRLYHPFNMNGGATVVIAITISSAA